MVFSYVGFIGKDRLFLPLPHRLRQKKAHRKTEKASASQDWEADAFSA
ncbi:MAG: hypothetical protein MRZ70_05260 [Prevotella sp.]|nr:hypothetical protein [Prevotella sp.]